MRVGLDVLAKSVVGELCALGFILGRAFGPLDDVVGLAHRWLRVVDGQRLRSVFSPMMRARLPASSRASCAPSARGSRTPRNFKTYKCPQMSPRIRIRAWPQMFIRPETESLPAHRETPSVDSHQRSSRSSTSRVQVQSSAHK